MNWNGHVAIVTGAGSGIGQAIAERFAEAGAEVVIGELSPSRGEAVAADLQRRFGRGRFVGCDVSRPADCQALIARTLDACGRLDTLVNNAGVDFQKPTLEVGESDWERVIGVDLKGAFFCSRYALEAMAARRAGSIINIASVHALAALPAAAPYEAAKGGLVAMSRSMAVEFAPCGIRVNSVSPGLTATQIWKDILAQGDRAALEKVWFDNIPMGRAQTPREVANVVLFLASDEASYMTGANVVTDGGMTAALCSRPVFAPPPNVPKAKE